jgi:hypothetical protein
MSCSYLLNPFGSQLLLISLCLCFVSVSMTCLLERVGCWSPPLLLCEFQCLFWTLVKFLLQVWVTFPLCYRCLEMRFHSDWIFFWWVWTVPSHFFWLLLIESLFNWILKWWLHLVSWDHLLENHFSSLLLWGSPVFVAEVSFLYAWKCWNLFAYKVC